MAIAIGVALSALTLQDANAAEVRAVRFGVTSASETRIVVDLAGAPSFERPTIGNDGRRVTMKLGEATLAKAAAASGRGGGMASSYDVRQQSEGVVSIEVDFKNPVAIKDIFLIPPSASNTNHRLVVDAIKATAASPILAAPSAQSSQTPTPYASMADLVESTTPKVAIEPQQAAMAAPTLKPTPAWAGVPARPVIVIDAGHGGTDPGAAGPAGTKESAVTLAAALALAEALEASNRYTVVLTRSNDSRLAHEERSRIAKDAKADLFMSIHADAHKDSKIRGGSVYTLSEEGEARSAREALAQGNYHIHDLDIGGVDPGISGILYDVAQKENETESDRFAEILAGRLRGVTPLLNNTHRRGNFKVLLAPDVPAVLLELAFISNDKDEKNLTSPAWRKKTMAAVAGAIDAYFDERSRALLARNSGASGSR